MPQVLMACPTDAIRPREKWIAGERFFPEVHKEECIVCLECMKKCPIEAIELGDDGFPMISEDDCVGCGFCTVNCPLMPDPAITVERKWKSP